MRHSTTQSTDVGLPRVTGDRYVPALLMSRETAFRQTIDERARFLLGFVDGTTPVFELLEASGMPLRDGVDALVILFEAGIIGLGEASQRISTPCAG